MPKPNATWRCYVNKVDAAVQTDKQQLHQINVKQKKTNKIDVSIATLTKLSSVSKHNATQCDVMQQVSSYNPPERPRPPSSCSLHLYDEIACQTSIVQTYVAAVQSVVAQNDIFCQTNVPAMTDASVTADINATSNSLDRPLTTPFIVGFDDNSAWSNIETQTDVGNWGVDFDDIWRHMQTQTTDDDETLISSLQQNIETQTSLIDFLDPAFQSAGTQT